MDIWSLIAEYVLFPNPKCERKRAGSILACASRMHKEAAEMALFRNRESFFCKLPIKIPFDQSMFWTVGPHPATFQFCRECSFEMRDDRDIVRIPEICDCLSFNAMTELRFRYTYCLAEYLVGECSDCDAVCLDAGQTVVEMMHHEDCGGCVEDLPMVCRQCHSVY
jgi:hypothetical protein